jgi:hypothetical protein
LQGKKCKKLNFFQNQNDTCAHLFTLVMKFHDRQSSERCIRKLISRHCLDKTHTRWNDFLFLSTDDRDFRPQTCTNGLVFIRPSLKRDILWYTNVRLSVRLSVRPFHMSRSNLRTPWPIHFKFHRDSFTDCILFGEILIFHSRVMGLYSSNCRRFFVCRAVNWEPLGQFTPNFAQLLELIGLRSVYFLVKFRFFIQELWERKSLQILYECWWRAYHALLAQLFIRECKHIKNIFEDVYFTKNSFHITLSKICI